MAWSLAAIEFVAWSVLQEDGSGEEVAGEALREACGANPFVAWNIAHREVFDEVCLLCNLEIGGHRESCRERERWESFLLLVSVSVAFGLLSVSPCRRDVIPMSSLLRTTSSVAIFASFRFSFHFVYRRSPFSRSLCSVIRVLFLLVFVGPRQHRSCQDGQQEMFNARCIACGWPSGAMTGGVA